MGSCLWRSIKLFAGFYSCSGGQPVSWKEEIDRSFKVSYTIRPVGDETIYKSNTSRDVRRIFFPLAAPFFFDPR
jgi:hypothetical protein